MPAPRAPLLAGRSKIRGKNKENGLSRLPFGTADVLGVIRLFSEDLFDVPGPGGEGPGFWWSVEFAGEEGGDPAWEEERLFDLASISGAMGSELVLEEGRPVLRAAYRSSREIGPLLAELGELLVHFPGIVLRAHGKVENRPWHTQHLDAFPPLEAGKGLLVMAPWHRDRAPEGRLPILIYPASAFGTGYHESTRIALELLEDVVRKGDTIVDVGTGTGILFIAALKLGAAYAVARDLDPATLDEVRRNMELNGLAPILCDLAVGDLLKGVETSADLLTANILLEPNTALLPDVRRVLKPEGAAIFSGMTAAEREVFLPALSAAGLSLERELHLGDWWGCRARPARLA